VAAAEAVATVCAVATRPANIRTPNIITIHPTRRMIHSFPKLPGENRASSLFDQGKCGAGANNRHRNTFSCNHFQ
jgi:hypothetical protein